MTKMVTNEKGKKPWRASNFFFYINYYHTRVSAQPKRCWVHGIQARTPLKNRTRRDEHAHYIRVNQNIFRFSLSLYGLSLRI